MRTLSLPLLFAFSGCVGFLMQGPAAAQAVTDAAGPTLSQITSGAVAGNVNCQAYSTLATFNGRTVPVAGQACRQSDGSWRIAEGTPWNPTQYVVNYEPTPAGYDGYGGPLLWAFPIGFSIGVPFFIDRDHHFHRFHDFGHFTRVGGFGHGGHFGGLHGGFGHR